MVDGMHVYSWPIHAKVATYGWSNRRPFAEAKPNYAGVKGGQTVRMVQTDTHPKCSFTEVVEDPNPISLAWIEDLLDIRRSSNLNFLSNGVGIEVGDDPSVFETHDEGGSKYGSKAVIGSSRDVGKDTQDKKLVGYQSFCTGDKNKVVGTPKSTYQTPSVGKKKVDKDKGSWIKKVRVKPVVTYDKTTRVDLDKRLSEAGSLSDGQDDRITKKDLGSLNSSPSKEDEGPTGEEGLRDGYEEELLPPLNRNKEGMFLPLGESELAEIGEINLSVVLRTPSPNVKNRKSRGAVSKLHGMRTRRDNRRESKFLDNRNDKNQPEERLEAAERGSDFTSKSKTSPKIGS
ncbi:hypothetical protein Q3G72_002942 [Acer saccharum]|nr:hypothetical protein Q3G72_002942 [Acer saccharum]